jgi:glycosyltransferase involved in cell wall biosynthesis
LRHIPKTTNTLMLNEYYNAVDYFMILSEYETYPTVCTEASATGTPIIGYRIEGVKEATLTASRFLFEFESNELLDFINDLQITIDKENKLIPQAHIDKDVMLKKYLNLYQEVHEWEI